MGHGRGRGAAGRGLCQFRSARRSRTKRGVSATLVRVQRDHGGRRSRRFRDRSSARPRASPSFPAWSAAASSSAACAGAGILSSRNNGEWSAPAFLTLTGGSFGLQIGGQAVDLILVINNRRGLENLVANQFKLGADVAVAAGPVGRDAQAATDLQLRARDSQLLAVARAVCGRDRQRQHRPPGSRRQPALLRQAARDEGDRVRRRPGSHPSRPPPGCRPSIATPSRRSRAAPLRARGAGTRSRRSAPSGSTRWPVSSSPAISPRATRSANAGAGISDGLRSTRPSVRENSHS